MAQQIQELINKIKSEGIDQAEKKSKQIETEAQQEAVKIVEKAKKQAEAIVIKANEEAKQIKESTQTSLKQSSRDMILILKEEINRILLGILSKEIHDSLTSDQLGEIIISAVKSYFKESSAKGEAIVQLNSKDLDKFKKGFIKKLQDKLKQSIEFQSAEDIERGFVISFDEGKSSFDCTDESLVNCLSSYLSEELKSLLKESISSKK